MEFHVGIWTEIQAVYREISQKKEKEKISDLSNSIETEPMIIVAFTCYTKQKIIV